jgi:hypothetical protein
MLSPDGNENPFFEKSYFFLALQNDQRKFLQGLGKKDFMKKDQKEQLEIAPDFSFRRNDNYDFFKYIYIMIRKIK